MTHLAFTGSLGSVNKMLKMVCFTIQHKTLAAQNLGGFGTTRNLVEKILVADHTNNSSLFELTRTTFSR